MCWSQAPRFHSFDRLNIWRFLLLIFCISAFWGASLLTTWLTWPMGCYQTCRRGPRPLVYAWFAVVIPLPLPRHYIPMVFCRAKTWRTKLTHPNSFSWTHLGQQSSGKVPDTSPESHSSLKSCTSLPYIWQTHVWALQRSAGPYWGFEVVWERHLQWQWGECWQMNVHVFGPVVFWIRAMCVSLEHLHLTACTPCRYLVIKKSDANGSRRTNGTSIFRDWKLTQIIWDVRWWNPLRRKRASPLWWWWWAVI